MTMFQLDYSTATVKRLSQYTTDANGNKKSQYSETVIATVKWYLSPVSSSNQDVWLDRFGQAWNFECNAPLDVKESDIMTIDGVDYEVKSFAHVKWIMIDRVRVVLVLPKNE